MATIGVSASALTGDTASGGTNTSVPVVGARANDAPITLEVTRVTPPNLPEYLDPFGKPPPCGPGNITDFPISPIMIDGELWIIIKNGYGEPVARYKGTNIETAVRQPDGRMNRTHPVHGTVTHPYILGRLWYDASDKKLYAPMHCESAGYTAGPGIVLRQVHLASSADKGLTWNYEGAILKEAPATAPLADSGLYWNGGDGDFYLYSDEASGYHYIFTTYYLWPKPGVKAPFFMRHRVARCKFSDKMAPGKWQRFYNGGWTEPGIGGKSSYVDAHCVVYNTFLGKYLGFNYGSTVAVCTDLAKQDWSPSYYVPGDCWGTQKNLEITPMDEGKTNPWTCGKTFYVYTYLQGWNGGTGQVYRVDLGVGQPLGAAGFSGWGTGMDAKKFFDPDWEGRPTMDPLRPYGVPSYDSADPIESRRTRTVGCDSSEATYKGTWAGAAPAKASGTAKDSVSLVFQANAIYWRAEQGPDCGKADVYLDGVLQKTVDCFGIPSPYKFWFVKTGLDPAKQHTITVVVRGDKNAKSAGTAVKHMSFEYAADSTQASLGFCGVMGKNDWYYLAWDGSAYSKLDFDAKENLWRKGGKLVVGHDFMAPDGNTSAVRQWQAPHAGKVRVEGVVSVAGGKGDGVTAAVLHNTGTNWPARVVQPGKPLSCDFVVAVTKGDTLSFVVNRNGTTGTDDRALWDPVITFMAP